MISKEMSLIISFYRNISLMAYILLVYLFSSCVTQRNIEYLQEKADSSKAFSEAEFPDYKLKSNDELYIQISSLDEEAANVFSNSRQQNSYYASMSPYGASLLSYPVNREGYLLLPVIGEILVKDKTLSDVRIILRDSLSHILNHPIVSVKLVNRYVSILGEVKNPGHYPYSQEKLSIYDAIGLAGDISVFGNRDKVILVRNENGENIRTTLNLTRSDILASDYYYMRPNDIVYVKPLGKRFWGMSEFPFTLLFSTITTGLLIYSIFK